MAIVQPILSFIALPSWVDRNRVHLATLAAVVLLPLVVGFVSLRPVAPDRRPRGRTATAKAVLKGRYRSPLARAHPLRLSHRQAARTHVRMYAQRTHGIDLAAAYPQAFSIRRRPA